MTDVMARVSVSGPPHRLAHLDALRGVAILGVIACHHVLEFPGIESRWALAAIGRLGVQLFFVVSAVTLCRAAEARAEAGLGAFYLRRVLRIAPLYYLGLALYAAVRWRWPGLAPAGEAPDLYAAGNVVANLLFVHGFMPGAYNHVVPGGWSIGVEMTFYLLFPALFAGASEVERRGGVRALAAASAAAWVSGVGLQLLVGRWLGRGPDDPFIASSIANQLPVFLIGITGYFAVERGAVRIPEAGKWLVLTGVPLLVLILRPMPLVDQVVPTLAAIVFVFALAVVRDRSAGRWIVLIGRRSYSMYILHFLPVWVAGALVEGAGVTGQRLWCLPLLAVVLIATYGAAGVTERLVERPPVALGQRWMARWRDAACIGGVRLYESALP